MSRFEEISAKLASDDADDARALAIAGKSRANAERKMATWKVNKEREAVSRRERATADAAAKVNKERAAAATSMLRTAPLIKASAARESERKQTRARVAKAEDDRKIKAVLGLKQHTDTAVGPAQPSPRGVAAHRFRPRDCSAPEPRWPVCAHKCAWPVTAFSTRKLVERV
jgi:hypothetical protein